MKRPELSGIPSTHWSRVLAASDPGAPAGTEALNRLLEIYRGPLIRHLESRFRLATPQAEDLFHGFCEERILVGSILASASASRGRFRNFILRSLENYALNSFRNARVRKRQPDGGFVSWDELEGWDPECWQGGDTVAFDFEWAVTVMNQARERMKQECDQGGRGDVWGVFWGRVLGPYLEGKPVVAYDVLVRQFGFASPDQAGNIMITGKRMFLRCLRSVIAEYVESPPQVDEELQSLVQVLSDPRFEMVGGGRVRLEQAWTS